MLERECIPYAPALIDSMRFMGYSFPSAIADLIDNSISANASHIEILSTPSTDPIQIKMWIFFVFGMHRSCTLKCVCSYLHFVRKYMSLLQEKIVTLKMLHNGVNARPVGIWQKNRPGVFKAVSFRPYVPNRISYILKKRQKQNKELQMKLTH